MYTNKQALVPNLQHKHISQALGNIRTNKQSYITTTCHPYNYQPPEIMPFPSLSKSKPSPRTDTRPLLYAQSQSPSTLSLAPSSTTNNTAQPNLSDPNDEPKNPQTESQQDTPIPLTRPKTPPQSTNHLPWSSYHNLPPDHPVFRYPDEIREKMYAKGVGT